MASRRSSRTSSGISPAALSLGVILVAAVGVLVLVSQMGPPPKEEEPVEEIDPFASVPDEEPPPVSTRRGSEGSTPSEANPFSGVVPKLREDQLWIDASEIAERGLALFEAAAAAKAADDFAGFKEKGAEAKKELEKALDLTRDLEQQAVATYGDRHAEVRSVVRARKHWRNQLVALKKTVGL